MVRASTALTAFAAASFSVSLVAAQGGRAVDPEAWHPEKASIEQGRAIVVGAYGQGPGGACFSCHGMDGRGDPAAAFPRLTGQVYKYLYDSLKDYASGARQNEIMTPIAQALTDRQMRDVSAYYAAQKQAPLGQRPAADSFLIQSGAAIAAIGHAERGVQGCINCHGPDGVGLPPTYPSLAGQYADYMEAQLRAWKTGARKGDRFGIMENIAKRLSDEEIRAVSLYYASLRPLSVAPEKAETGTPMVPLPTATQSLEARP